MKRRSINDRINLILAIILILVAILFANFTLGWRLNSAEKRSRAVLSVEARFYDALFMENAALLESEQRALLEKSYDELLAKLDSLRLTSAKTRLLTRRELFNECFELQRNTSGLYQNVHSLLPNLVDSVRYIHSHHLAYLKNLLSRGVYVQDYDVGESFTRSQVKAAPELDIIDAAVKIQTSLLDIFNCFYELQRGYSPSEVKVKFSDRIKHFFDRVNTFEDMSLDAQDGLLVEELLMNGRTFQQWFTNLLNLEQDKGNHFISLAYNRAALLATLHETEAQLEASTQHLRFNIRSLQIAMLICAVILALYILYSGKQIAGEFRRIVVQTEKIRDDTSYQIEATEDDFEEFRVVFDALNSMAGTINAQIKILEESQDKLSKEVAERTAEILSANDQLKKEIADRIRAEELRENLETQLRRAQKMEAIGTLAGGVAHDLNNILAGLVSYPELILLELPEDTPLRRAIETIRSSGEKAAAVVQDLLTLSRRGIMTPAVVNLNDIVQEYVHSPEFAKLKSYHPNLRVHLKLDSELGNIKGSRVHLSKTLMNLVTNAAEAMPDGGSVTISTYDRYVDTSVPGFEDVQEGDYSVMVVADTGLGIPAEDLERIFEPFFSRKTPGRSGSGLGMAVVWGTIKDHGGYIDVASVEGQGTTFTLYFPLTRDRIEKPLLEVPLEAYRSLGETILVVDDVETQRQVGAQMLRHLGYVVHTVSSGEMAIEYLRNHAVDLIILDMIMTPGMNGLETYRQAVALHPGQKAVITSGFSESELVREAQNLGAGSYVRKPFSLAKIGRAVRRELDKGLDKDRIPVQLPDEGCDKADITESAAGFETAAPAQFLAGSNDLREYGFEVDAQAPIPLSPGKVPKWRGRILVADDNRVIQEVAKDALQVFGCQVEIVGNGREALESLEQRRYDLVMMDCQMPEMDGCEAARAIRQKEASNRSIPRVPIVAMTGDEASDDQKQCLKAGMDDFLEKPFRMKQLQNILERWLPKESQAEYPASIQAAGGVANTVVPEEHGFGMRQSLAPSRVGGCIDLEVLNRLRALQPPGVTDLLGRLVKTYLRETPAMMQSLRVAVESCDQGSVQRAAHSLKSSSAYLGAKDLSALFIQIEALAGANSIETVNQMLPEVFGEFERVREALLAEI